MKKPANAICTSPEWLGRAHCEKCHIRRLMLFSKLPEATFDDLLQPIDHLLYPPDSALYDDSTRKKFIYSIRRGMVKLVHTGHNGDHRIVRLVGPGSAIGLELLDGDDDYHHSAIAVNQVDLCRIPLSTISRLEHNHPLLCDQVRRQLQSQLDQADQWISALGTGNARQRVANLLLILSDFSTEKSGAFMLLSREDMAAMIGIALETVSRIVAEFKRLKLLRKTTDNLYLCNVAELQEISRGD